VHRPGYLDYVVIKEFDRRGRLTGEAQFLGLWTSNTYHADPRTVPLMRLKVARVIGAFPFRPSSHDSKRLVSILDNLPRDELFQASIAEPHALRARGAGAARPAARGMPGPAAR
jgi:glutamate dehydrogenase